MRLRPYVHANDFPHVEKWVNEERIHALWCANLIPYPISKETLGDFLEKDARDWGGKAYIAEEDDGIPVGFFVYSVNVQDNSGFLKFLVLDPELRGKGYGRQMVRLALEYAFDITEALFVQLNVFEGNDRARQCYAKIGFVEKSRMENVFQFKNEQWARYNLAISREEYDRRNRESK